MKVVGIHYSALEELDLREVTLEKTLKFETRFLPVEQRGRASILQRYENLPV